ncbi:MAG: 4-(cytidine 5'-diphospho)-2-C-methyl-D-erythritol kinase [Ignavibacteria bacterium]|nr:4-(cytidine 5'-diphospho)-2-C-methyl-D-erythritol kinase [Ignavibacteria bacterium]
MTGSAYAYAKVNIGLQILGKRTDGFHDINSIFVAVDLADQIEIDTATSQISVDCTPNVTTNQESNLAFIAAAKLRQALQQPTLGANIQISKRIPAGAGLGGGSSNAATTLLLLQKLWPNVSTQLIESIAPEIGSDVPFFIKNGVAAVSGRGEVVSPLAITLPWYFLLVVPNIHADTTQAYSTLGITQHKVPFELASELVHSFDNQQLNPIVFNNDFETSLFAQYPLLSTLKHELINNGAVFASMSGSGSTVYGLYTNVDNAMAAESVVNTNHAGLKTYICRPI